MLIFRISNILTFTTLTSVTHTTYVGITRIKAGKYTQKIRTCQRFCANF